MSARFLLSGRQSISFSDARRLEVGAPPGARQRLGTKRLPAKRPPQDFVGSGEEVLAVDGVPTAVDLPGDHVVLGIDLGRRRPSGPVPLGAGAGGEVS